MISDVGKYREVEQLFAVYSFLNVSDSAGTVLEEDNQQGFN
jgi:hypothetical protein